MWFCFTILDTSRIKLPQIHNILGYFYQHNLMTSPNLTTFFQPSHVVLFHHTSTSSMNPSKNITSNHGIKIRVDITGPDLTNIPTWKSTRFCFNTFDNFSIILSQIIRFWGWFFNMSWCTWSQYPVQQVLQINHEHGSVSRSSIPPG